jgi:hypothetical protein
VTRHTDSARITYSRAGPAAGGAGSAGPADAQGQPTAAKICTKVGGEGEGKEGRQLKPAPHTERGRSLAGPAAAAWPPC